MQSGPRSRRVIALLDIDPDLAIGVPDEERTIARERSAAEIIEIEARVWDPESLCKDAGEGSLGLFVIDGLLLRKVSFGRRSASELLARGDILRPWDADGDYEPLTIDVEWRALRDAHLAVLDASFARRMAPWPSVTSKIACRIAGRARYLALNSLVAHQPRAESRLLLLFWLFANRWGKDVPDGVRISLPLTHELLATLAGTNRPTITGALTRLSRAGLLEREQPGCWLLRSKAIASLTRLEPVTHAHHGGSGSRRAGGAEAFLGDT